MILHTPEELLPLARSLLERLPEGSLLLLDGPLGSGKTSLVQALAEALGSDAAVSSPTYTLIHEYPTPEGTLVHIDAWRLPEAEQLVATGLDEYLDHARLVAVEWGGGLRRLYPEAMLLTLKVNSDGSRTVSLDGPG